MILWKILYFAEILNQHKYMGVIQRQGIKDSIVMYFSVAIGAVNALFIYPAYLTDAELGLF